MKPLMTMRMKKRPMLNSEHHEVEVDKSEVDEEEGFKRFNTMEGTEAMKKV